MSANRRISVASVRQGVVYRLLAALLFAVMFGLIKSMGQTYPIGQIVFIRSLFAMIPVIWLIYYLGDWQALRTTRLAVHMARSMFGTAALFFSFTAVGMLDLATAMAINYTAPLFMALFALALPGETINRSGWFVLLLGFGGVLLIVKPDMASGLKPGMLPALLGAITAAAAMIAIRTMAHTEKGAVITFYFTLFGAVVGAGSLLVDVVAIRPADLVALAAIGLLGGIAQILLTFAYQQSAVSVLAPLEYATLIFAILIGYLFWNDLPGWREWLGIAVIVGANLWLLAHQWYLARQSGESLS